MERIVRRIGAGALLVALGSIFWGVWQGLRRPVRPGGGPSARLLRRPAFIVVLAAGYFGVCVRLWRPIAPDLSRPARAAASGLGAIFYFAGLGLVMWGRLTLGEMYNVSSSLGAQLYEDHRLVTTGPFAYVRHPMYLGVLLTSVGGVLLYRTWTFVAAALSFLPLIVRARREEAALAAAFGEQWLEYCRRTPGWIPVPRGATRNAGTGERRRRLTL